MENREQEKLARAAFLSLKNVGSRHLSRLINCFGSARAAWEAPQIEYLHLSEKSPWFAGVGEERNTVDLLKLGRLLSDLGIQTTSPQEQDYPVLLGELADAPPLLFYRGKLRGKAEMLAVVGSRQATAYGKAAASFLSKAAAAEGIVVVSGLARGIDAAAHRGALEGDGITWAFLACGLDRVYPAEHQRLAEEILLQGALLSEYAPGMPPIARNFPARNRLISGCARGVLVVEAAERSGALITADFALEQGREVFAVPGPIFSKQSRGTHNLLRQGAKVSESIEDIVQEIPAWYPENRTNFRHAGKNLPDHEELGPVLEQLSDVPLHFDQLVARADLSPSKLSLVLWELLLAGKILQLPGQHYVLSRKN